MPTPNEMFVATLAALTAVQTALENKQQQQQQNDDPATMMQEQSSPSMNDTASELENTVIPLLEILRRILPYVANYGNNRGALLAHQLGTVSRSLRLFVAMAYALPAGTPDGKHGRKKRLNNNDGNNHTGAASGANALLRQILKTTTTLLLVPPSSVSEKDVAKLLHHHPHVSRRSSQGTKGGLGMRHRNRHRGVRFPFGVSLHRIVDGTRSGARTRRRGAFPAQETGGGFPLGVLSGGSHVETQIGRRGRHGKGIVDEVDARFEVLGGVSSVCGR